MNFVFEKVKNIDWDHIKYEAWWTWRLIKMIWNPPKDIREEFSEVIYKPIEVMDVWRVCSVAYTNPEKNIILTSDNIQARFFHLKGINYDSISFEQLCQKHEDMKVFLEQLPHDLKVTFFSRRFLKKNQKQPIEENRCSTIGKELLDCWEQSFEDTHENQFVLMVQTALPTKDVNDDDEWALFERTTDSFQSRLSFLRAKELKEDDLASFLHSLLKMDPLSRWSMPSDGVIEDSFPGSDIEFLPNSTFKARVNQTEYHSCCIVAKKPLSSKKFSGRPMEKLFSQPREFCMVQQVERLPKETAFNHQLNKLKTASLGGRFKKLIHGKLEDTLERIEADQLHVFNFSTAIHLMETSEESLLKAEAEFIAILSRAAIDLSFARETLVHQGTYWSMWPGLSHLTPRKHMISSEELPHLLSAPETSSGEVSTPWSKEPLVKLRTAQGGQFGFSFHQSAQESANGNSLIVGGTGMGKTTLISFIISNAMKISNMRSVAFDHFSGMKIPTLLQDGDYISFDGHRSDINPFHLKGTETDKKFILSWLLELAGPATPEEISDLEIFIEVMFNWSIEDRGFHCFLQKLDDNGPGTFASRLKKWGSDQFFGGYFQGKRDCLDFKHRRLAFDMEKIISQEEVLRAMCSYLFYKIERLQIEDPSPGILFFDEASIYLSNKLLGQKALDALRTYRKRNWAVILACQSLGDIANLKIGNAALSNIETFLFYPEPSAQYDIYHQVAGLTKTEFEWIRGYARRQVMLKRRGGESVILDVDLSPLGKHLRVFDSNAKAVFDYDRIGKDEPNEEYGDVFNLPDELNFMVQIPKYLVPFSNEDLGLGAARIMVEKCLPSVFHRKVSRQELVTKRITIRSAKSVRHFRKFEEHMKSRKAAAKAAIGYFWEKAFEAGRVGLDVSFSQNEKK